MTRQTAYRVLSLIQSLHVKRKLRINKVKSLINERPRTRETSPTDGNRAKLNDSIRVRGNSIKFNNIVLSAINVIKDHPKASVEDLLKIWGRTTNRMASLLRIRI